jgi:flagellar hook-associated protein 3 FlgL
MRIGSANAYDSAINNLLERQTQLAQAQDQLTSGRRVSRASDDPAAAAVAERALAMEHRTTVSQRAVDSSKASMEQAESALSDATELLQRARDLVVSGGNAGYTLAERKQLAEELRGVRTQLLAVANRASTEGGFLFSAQGSSSPPFVDQPPDATLPPERTGVVFKGSPGVIRTEQRTGLPLSTDGHAAWVSARTGNGVFETRAASNVQNAWIDSGQVTDPSALQSANYAVSFSVTGGTSTYSIVRTTDVPPSSSNVVTDEPYQPGKAISLDGMSFTISGDPADGDQFSIQPAVSALNVFGVVDKAIADLSSPTATNAQRKQANGENLRNLDAVMFNIQTERTAAGEVLNRTDIETNLLADQKLLARGARAQAEDLDIAEAISTFQSKQSGYDAALRSYAMVQRLSLFQYVSG